MRYYSSVAQETVLFSPMTSTQTTATVDAIVGYPLSFPFTIAVDYDTALEELMDVTGYTGDVFTVTRGVDNTSAVEHAAGAKVRHVASGRDFADTQTHTASTTDVHGVSGDVVGTDDAQILTNKTISATNNTLQGVVLRSNGSVTAASTTQGVVRNIWVSPNQPTGGAEGDVWLQYE